MLQPTNRLTLIDAMRPPIGFRIESGMAVTFTLDLRALLAAPAALALTGPAGIASDDGRHEPIELLHALRYHANKITVFSQVGEIALHAKVFAYESEGRARLFLGSANATGAAFHNNVEILVELAGSTAVLGIDRLCDGTDDEPGLRVLFNDYKPSPNGGSDGASPLDHARHTIAKLPFTGIVEESGSGWAVTYRSREPMPVVDGTEIHCWPLASAGNRRRVAMGDPLEVRFETSLEAISGFLAFELAHEEGTLTGFVVPVALTSVPEHRERALLRSLVGNAERFLRYLLALLDEESGQTDLLDAVERVSRDAATDRHGPASLPVLEKLLRAMRRDPAKLAGLHPLVSDLAADDALPEGFAELWAMIYDVADVGAVTR